MKYDLVVIGSGESGVGTALLAQHLGMSVFVSDHGTIAPKYQDELTAHGIAFETGGHASEAAILQAKTVVKSPGVPEKAPIIQALRAKKRPIIGEIEFAWLHMRRPARVVAITGSNGKTTTTTLATHILQTGGMNVYMGGNIGYSFARLVLDELKRPKPVATKYAYSQPVFVLELSSFQLDDIDRFTPDIAVLLNITPDHLDRYDYKLENYINSKFRIAKNMTRKHRFFVNTSDPIIAERLEVNKPEDTYVINPVSPIGTPPYMLKRNGLKINMRDTKLIGRHNGLNAKMAVAIAQQLMVPDQAIEKGLLTYAPPPHRMELVAKKEGITWINDSKATNVDSVYYALDAASSPIIWIVGGVDKGNDYSPLMPAVSTKVKAIICLGTDNKKLLEVFGPMINGRIHDTKTIEQAISTARSLATSGDTVLLSPACASFDLFKNYEDRGDQFRELITNYEL
jgi:UDP-N-acetylmuramoylalanine--D-glutamate ligase